jgi:hypothetical protein
MSALLMASTPSPDRDGRISTEQRRGLSSLAGLVHLPT